MEKTRRIFNEMILNKGNVGKFAVEWLEFYDLEKLYGDEKHQRKLLNRALNEVKDATEKEIIYELLLKFEKLNGNVHQFNTLYWKYEQFKLARQIELAANAAKKFEKKQPPIKTAKKPETIRPKDKSAGGDDTSKSIKVEKQQQQQQQIKAPLNNLKRKVILNRDVEI